MMRDASEHVEMGWGALWVGRVATSAMTPSSGQQPAVAPSSGQRFHFSNY